MPQALAVDPGARTTSNPADATHNVLVRTRHDTSRRRCGEAKCRSGLPIRGQIRVHHLRGHLTRVAERCLAALPTVRARLPAAAPVLHLVLGARTVAVVVGDRRVDDRSLDARALFGRQRSRRARLGLGRNDDGLRLGFRRSDDRFGHSVGCRRCVGERRRCLDDRLRRRRHLRPVPIRSRTREPDPQREHDSCPTHDPHPTMLHRDGAWQLHSRISVVGVSIRRGEALTRSIRHGFDRNRRVKSPRRPETR
jgi:hypothetical protein